MGNKAVVNDRRWTRRNEETPPERGFLVAHRGFEPLVSSLRGRCPRPLDECAPVHVRLIV